jgi:hypothetical protein
VLGADPGDMLEALDRGVDPPEPELEEANRLARQRLDRLAAVMSAQLDRLCGMAATVARSTQTGFDGGQPREARHDLDAEAGRLGGTERLESGGMSGRPVAKAVLELCQLGESARKRRDGVGAVEQSDLPV